MVRGICVFSLSEEESRGGRSVEWWAEEEYYSSPCPTPLPPLSSLSWRSMLSGTVFFSPPGFLCRSGGCIARIQQAQSEEMLRVHPKSTKLEAALCLLYNAFSGAGYLEELWTLKEKKTTGRSSHLTSCLVGKWKERWRVCFSSTFYKRKKKHPPLTLSLDFTSDRVSLDN